METGTGGTYWLVNATVFWPPARANAGAFTTPLAGVTDCAAPPFTETFVVQPAPGSGSVTEHDAPAAAPGSVGATDAPPATGAVVNAPGQVPLNVAVCASCGDPAGARTVFETINDVGGAAELAIVTFETAWRS